MIGLGRSPDSGSLAVSEFPARVCRPEERVRIQYLSLVPATNDGQRTLTPGAHPDADRAAHAEADRASHLNLQADIDVEVAVLGAGLMGAATAWELTRRGHSVALVEAFDIGHAHGSSHGTERIYRRAYADPLYVAMTGAAEDRWAELEADAGVALRLPTGGLDHGSSHRIDLIAAELAAAGVEHQVLTASEAMRRWPDFSFDGPVLFHPAAGTLNAAATVAACVRLASGRGATVLSGTRCTALEATDRVRLRTSGPTITADRVVVAAGPWLPHTTITVDGRPVPMPRLTVTQQQVFHFERHNPTHEMPVFIHEGADEVETYGLRSGADGGQNPSYKVAFHNHGSVTTPDTRTAAIDPAGRAKIIDYVRRYLPGLDSEPVAELTCLYTRTASEDFVLDRFGPVVLASPCSGHGAKFTPLIGALVADLALGADQSEFRFTVAAHS